MVLLSCQTIADYPSANGAMAFLFSIRDCIPFAYQGALIAILMVLFAGSYFFTKAKTGRAKILVPLLASCFSMIPLSLTLALATLVSFTTVLFYGFLTIIVFILFVLSDNS